MEGRPKPAMWSQSYTALGAAPGLEPGLFLGSVYHCQRGCTGVKLVGGVDTTPKFARGADKYSSALFYVRCLYISF